MNDGLLGPKLTLGHAHQCTRGRSCRAPACRQSCPVWRVSTSNDPRRHDAGAPLTSISDSTSEEDIRLIQAAVKYLPRESGDEHYPRSSVGFDDEVLVVRTIAKATQPVGSND